MLRVLPVILSIVPALVHALVLHAARPPLAASPRWLAAGRTGGVALQVEPNNEGGGLGGVFRDAKSLWDRLIGTSPEAAVPPQLQLEPMAPTATDDLEFVPLVLVVGATGRTGRIIVRKLVRQGFRVAVLVRSLSTETLTLLGTGVSYSYGDMTDYRSLLDAMEDVDKVIFAAEAALEYEQELDGLAKVVRAFQDTRTFIYGEAEATKLTLLKLRRDADFARWSVEESRADDVSERLQQARTRHAEPSPYIHSICPPCAPSPTPPP